MKKVLCIILAFALLAVPSGIIAAAYNSDTYTDGGYDYTDGNESENNEQDDSDDEDARAWWEIVIDFIIGVLDRIIDIFAGFAPIVALVTLITNVVRTLGIVLAIVAVSGAVAAVALLAVTIVRLFA